MVNALLLAAVAVLGMALPAGADEPKSEETYVKIEARGVLESGLAAIGGETTGTVLRAKGATVELDFGKNKELRELASKLNKKTVLVTGTLSIRPGVEVPMRSIVRVATLKAAEADDK